MIERGCEVYILGMKDFDVIFRMNWLETHYVLLDRRHKRIVFQKSGEEEFTFQCPKTKSGKFFILTLKAGRMIERGCETFLASVVMDKVIDRSLKDAEVVRNLRMYFLNISLVYPLTRR